MYIYLKKKLLLGSLFFIFSSKRKKGWVFMLHAHSKVLRAGSEAGYCRQGVKVISGCSGSPKPFT